MIIYLKKHIFGCKLLSFFLSCSGKFQPGIDRPDPKTWKANFRCAMNSLPDIEEVKDKSIKKGTNAFRVYKMLSYPERCMKKGESLLREKINSRSRIFTEVTRLCCRKEEDRQRAQIERKQRKIFLIMK